MSLLKSRCISVLAASLLLVPVLCRARSPRSASGSSVAIDFAGPRGTFTLRRPDGTTIGPIASAIDLVDGSDWVTTELPKHKMERLDAAPAGLAAAGTREFVVRYYGKGGAPELRQHIYLRPGKFYVLVELEAVSDHPL